MSEQYFDSARNRASLDDWITGGGDPGGEMDKIEARIDEIEMALESDDLTDEARSDLEDELDELELDR